LKKESAILTARALT